MRHIVSAPPHVDVSSIVEGLAKAHGLTIETDPSRKMCEAYGYQTIYEMPLDLQKRARRQLIETHIASLKKQDRLVCDHSIFTWLADWMRWLWSETPAEEWEAVLDLSRPAVALYGTIHHVADGKPAAYDGYRWLDRRNGVQIERLLRHLYVDFGCSDRVLFDRK